MDVSGTRYQLDEAVETPAAAQKAPVWPWIVGGVAVVGGLLWMASSRRMINPISFNEDLLVTEARDPQTPMQRLWTIYDYQRGKFRPVLLDNPDLCPIGKNGKPQIALLKALAEEFHEEIAQHPTFVLNAIVEPIHDMEMVVLEVAQRTSDLGLIEQLLTNFWASSIDVRVAVAKNPNTPEVVLENMSTKEMESNPLVRQAVAKNPNVSERVLRKMIRKEIEPSWGVRHIAKTSLVSRRFEE